jgi:hypothetical protein
MKKLYIGIITFLVGFTLHGQIPNQSFENWTGTQPNGWTAMFTQPFSPYNFETQSTLAFQGTKALKSEVLQMPSSTVQIATGVYTGTSSSNYYVPIGPKPTKLYGWYIFQNNLDSVTFNISVKSAGSVVGTGKFTSITTTSVYTQFTININYTSAAVPDSFRVGLSINGAGPQFTSQGHVGTYFIADNLFFDINVGIHENNLEERISIYPNPANDRLTFQNIDNKTHLSIIEIFDAKGQLIKKYFINEDLFFLNLNDYNSGLYFAKLTSSDGVASMQKFIKP